MCRDKCNLLAGRNAKNELPRKHVRRSIHNSRLIIKVLPSNLVHSLEKSPDLWALCPHWIVGEWFFSEVFKYLVSWTYTQACNVLIFTFVGLFWTSAKVYIQSLMDVDGHIHEWAISHPYHDIHFKRLFKDFENLFSGVILHCKFKRS